jgi:hypothetical protein
MPVEIESTYRADGGGRSYLSEFCKNLYNPLDFDFFKWVILKLALAVDMSANCACLLQKNQKILLGEKRNGKTHI